jgi:hypothetical protein
MCIDLSSVAFVFFCIALCILGFSRKKDGCISCGDGTAQFGVLICKIELSHSVAGRFINADSFAVLQVESIRPESSE